MTQIKFARSIRDWLTTLPEPHQTLAIRYYEAYSKIRRIPEMRTSLQDALLCAFPWHKTREGSEYWVGVFEGRDGTITPCVSEAPTNSLTINTIKLNDFFEY